MKRTFLLLISALMVSVVSYGGSWGCNGGTFDGTSIEWQIYGDEGTISYRIEVTGAGEIPDFPSDCETPWCGGCGDEVLSIVLDGNITSVGNYTFYNCHNLVQITCNGSEPPMLKENTFNPANYPQYTVIVPYGSSAQYTASPYWSQMNIQESEGGFPDPADDPESNPYTITFIRNGATESTTVSGTDYTLPTAGDEADACDGWAFKGWITSESAFAEGQSSVPEFVTSVNSTSTLYAVYGQDSGDGGTGSGETWELVRDASMLNAGDVLVIACNSKGVTAGDISSSVLSSVTSTFSSEDDYSTITSLGDGTMEFTLAGSQGAWILNSMSGALGATAVKKLAWGSGTTTWTITIESGNATITNTNSSFGSMLYNTGTPRFTTYSSGASSTMIQPQLYRKVSSAGTTTMTIYKQQPCETTNPDTPDNNYTIHWSANGVEIYTNTYPQGSMITELPESPSVCTDFVFAGWSDQQIAGSQSWMPTIYTSTGDFPSVTEDKTYYAVFRKGDVLTTSETMMDMLTTTEIGGTSSYKEWSDVSASSGTLYAGYSKTSGSYLVMRGTDSQSGVVNTTSVGQAVGIIIEWYGTNSGAIFNVYGSHSPFFSAADLYSGTTTTMLGTITYDGASSSTLDLTERYPYIGIKPEGSSTVNISKFTFIWDVPQSTDAYEYVTSCDNSTPTGGDDPITGEQYTVYWSVDGSIYSTTTIEAGQSITELPTTPSACDGYTFAGWSNEPISGTQSVTPSILYNNTYEFPSVSQDVTYYAVFTKGTGSASAESKTYTYSRDNQEAEWENTATDKSSYWLLEQGTTTSSPMIELSTITSISVNIRTYGGATNNTLTVSANEVTIAEIQATNGSTLSDYEWTPTEPISGYSRLVFSSNYGTSKGIAFTSITITTKGNGATTATEYITACDNTSTDPQMDDEFVTFELDTTWRFIMLPSMFGLEAGDIATSDSVIWARYDGERRAAGSTGWTKVDFNMTYYKDWGHIVRAKNGSATLSIRVPQNATSATAEIHVNSYPSNHEENANWNLIGNPYNARYDIMSMLESAGVTAPLTLWNGVGYSTKTPGLDTLTLQPFETFFIQLPDNTSTTLNFQPQYIVGDSVNTGGDSGSTAADENGALPGYFSVGEGTQVQFARGNLQYQASTGTWQFAESQYVMIGKTNENISASYDGWIDLFGWGTGNNPTKATKTTGDYSTFTDWGTNAISNGGNTADFWRTLTSDEWTYLISARANATSLYGLGSVNDVKGLLLLPDNWSGGAGVTITTGNGDFSQNTLSLAEWNKLECAGVVFLPAAGYRYGTSVETGGSYGSYWSSTPNETGDALYLHFESGEADAEYTETRDFGFSVRLAHQNIVEYNTKYAVRWMINGETLRIDSVLENTSVVDLPANPSSCSSSSETFMGWTRTEIAETTQIAPTDLFTTQANAPVVNEEVTYYAVFAHAEQHENYVTKTQDFGSFTSGTTMTSVNAGEVMIMFNKGAASNDPVYNGGVRCYAKSTIIFSGAHMTQIVFEAGSSDKGNDLIPDTGTMGSTTTWSGSASDVVFTVDGTSGYRGIGAITVTYAESTTVTYRNYLTSCSSTDDTGDSYETIEGELSGAFSISEGVQVHFSRGNLQYQASTDTWRFAETQYSYIGEENTTNISDPTSDGWIDLFGWGTGDNPNKSTQNGSMYSEFSDWGNNAIINGGNITNAWQTLKSDEWTYLLQSRANATQLQGVATVNGYTGLILLPDDWFDTGNTSLVSSYTSIDWESMESAGAVFLPAAGYRWGSSKMYEVGVSGEYWSASFCTTDEAYDLDFKSGSVTPASTYSREYGFSVRLVRQIQ